MAHAVSGGCEGPILDPVAPCQELQPQIPFPSSQRPQQGCVLWTGRAWLRQG